MRPSGRSPPAPPRVTCGSGLAHCPQVITQLRTPLQLTRFRPYGSVLGQTVGRLDVRPDAVVGCRMVADMKVRCETANVANYESFWLATAAAAPVIA